MTMWLTHGAMKQMSSMETFTRVDTFEARGIHRANGFSAHDAQRRSRW